MTSYNYLIEFIQEFYPRRHYRFVTAQGVVFNANWYWVKQAIRDVNAFKRSQNPVTMLSMDVTREDIEHLMELDKRQRQQEAEYMNKYKVYAEDNETETGDRL